MIKWSELDKNKYYYRFLCVKQYRGFYDLTALKHVTLYDYIANVEIELCEVIIDTMLKDDCIEIIGMPKDYRNWKITTYTEHLIKIQGDSLVTYDIENYRGEAQANIYNYVWNEEAGQYYNRMDNSKMPKEYVDSELEIDKLVVIVDETDEFDKYKLVMPEGVTINRFRECTIKDAKNEVVSVPEGVIRVDLVEDCGILSELLLPDSCKYVQTYEIYKVATKLKRLIGRGLFTISLSDMKINELDIGNNVRRVNSKANSGNVVVEKFKGKLRLQGDGINSVNLKVNGTLDLSDCVFYHCEAMGLSKETIYPDNIPYVHVRDLEKNAKLIFNGYIKYMDFFEDEKKYADAKATVVFKQGASERALRECEKYGIKVK